MMVLDFNDFLMRHGEGSVQAIVEQMEKANNIAHTHPLPLEDRWLIAMGAKILPAAEPFRRAA